MTPEDVRAVLHGPIAQELLQSDIPARFAYTALDGTPRVIPIGFWWDGERFLLFTIPGSPKDAALRANPDVALTIDTNQAPHKVLLVRGTATVDVVDGIPDEYLQASFRLMAEEKRAEFEAGVRWLYDQMARITIEPTWASSFDFVSSIPQAVAKRIAEVEARSAAE